MRRSSINDIISREAAEFRRQLDREAGVHWKSTFTVQQTGFRGRNDTVGLNVDTWTYALNTNWTQPFNTNFRVRLLAQESAAVAGSTVTIAGQFNVNGGTYADLTTTSAVKLSLTSQYANNDSITASLLGGSGSFDGGLGKESTNAISVGTWNASAHRVYEYCLQLDGTQLSNGNQIGLRFLFSAASIVIIDPSQEPVITAGTGGASFAAAQNAYRYAEDGTEAGATLIGSLNTPLSRTL